MPRGKKGTNRYTGYKAYTHAQIKEADDKANKAMAGAKTPVGLKRATRKKIEAIAMRKNWW